MRSRYVISLGCLNTAVLAFMALSRNIYRRTGRTPNRFAGLKPSCQPAEPTSPWLRYFCFQPHTWFFPDYRLPTFMEQIPGSLSHASFSWHERIDQSSKLQLQRLKLAASRRGKPIFRHIKFCAFLYRRLTPSVTPREYTPQQAYIMSSKIMLSFLALVSLTSAHVQIVSLRRIVST